MISFLPDHIGLKKTENYYVTFIEFGNTSLHKALLTSLEEQVCKSVISNIQTFEGESVNQSKCNDTTQCFLHAYM